MRTLLTSLLLVAPACQPGAIALDDEETDLPDETDVVDDTVDTDDSPVDDTDEPVDTEPDYSEYDGADLRVRFPVSGAIYPLTTGFPYEAVVVDANGAPLPFDDVTWTIPRGSQTGLSGQWAVPAGVYNVDVEAQLPNGDRLKASIGNVRVQSPYAGIWTGSIGIATFSEVQGQTIRTDCVGSLDFTVDVAGEVIDGRGGCSLVIPLLGTVDLTYDVVGDVVAPSIENGAIAIDIPFLQIPVPYEGGFPNPNTMRGTFAADLTILTMEGDIQARKVSPYVGP